MTEFVHGATRFHVVGTAHVSQRSVDEVREVIARVRPDVVCVELDQARHDTLIGGNAFRDLDVVQVVREGRTIYVLAHLALASYQRRIGTRLGVKPGAELLAAVEAARAAGIPVALIDRDIQITLKRTWRSLGLWRRVTLFGAMLFGGQGDAVPGAGAEPGGAADDAGDPTQDPTQATIEALKEPRALSELLAELGRQVPEIKTPLIDERDQYMASRLVEEAGGAGRICVVAVVGAAHVPGIEVELAASAELPGSASGEAAGGAIDRAALERIPPPPLGARVLPWLVRALFVALLCWGWQRTDATGAIGLMLAWILPTAVAAAAGTLLAGGALRSVVAAAAVAPVAAIYPPLQTGWVVGVVEASHRRPTAADCARLPDDIQSLRGFRTNPVTRILLIAAAAGVGTAVGFWIGVGWVTLRL
ncbi:MAG TPA: TraB/GumN family protein [Kofleriaceae bacterium]|nr:TraB/GumN family protein [Kofleriaceae bacterium]